MSDLTERLRTLAKAQHDDLSVGEEAAEEIECLRAELAAARKDAERLDWLDAMKHMGVGLIGDDNGHYAVSGDGMQNVPMDERPCDIETTFFVEADKWRDSVREAIDAAMKEPTP